MLKHARKRRITFGVDRPGTDFSSGNDDTGRTDKHRVKSARLRNIEEESGFIASMVGQPDFVICTGLGHDVHDGKWTNQREIDGLVNGYRKIKLVQDHHSVSMLMGCRQSKPALSGTVSVFIDLNHDADFADRVRLKPIGLSGNKGTGACAEPGHGLLGKRPIDVESRVASVCHLNAGHRATTWQEHIVLAKESRDKGGFGFNFDHDDGGRRDVAVGGANGQPIPVEIRSRIGRHRNGKGSGRRTSGGDVGQFVRLPLDVPTRWNR